MRVKAIDLVPWNWWGYMLMGGPPEEFVAWAKKHRKLEPTLSGSQDGHVTIKSGHPWLLWVRDGGPKGLPTLAHEIFHVVVAVLTDRGMVLTNDSDEAYAYSLTYLFRAALNPKGWKEVKP